jgi:hypothetical protein
MSAARHLADAKTAAADAVHSAQHLMDAVSRGQRITWDELDHIKRAATAALVRIEQARVNLEIREVA